MKVQHFLRLVICYSVDGVLVIQILQLPVSVVILQCFHTELSLVRALRSLANRRRVSVFPLAEQRCVYVSIGRGSRLTPASRIPE